MILVLIAVLAIAGLLLLYRSPHEQRIRLMSYIIVVLVVVNLLNQLVASLRYGAGSFAELNTSKRYVFSSAVYQTEQPPLLREEMLVVDYLEQRMKAGQHIVATVRNLHPQRFKQVFAEFQKRHSHVSAAHLSQREDPELDRYALGKAIQKQKGQFCFLLVDGYSDSAQLTLLKSVFESTSASLLFRSLPENFMRHGLAQYAEIIELPQSYFMPLLHKNYPVSMLELCSKYVPINYNFYLRTVSQPLSELCCGALPSNPVTECVRTHMRNQTDMVELSRLRNCLDKTTPTDGLILQNGMARVRKQYYWAGRCNISQFTSQPTDL